VLLTSLHTKLEIEVSSHTMAKNDLASICNHEMTLQSMLEAANSTSRKQLNDTQKTLDTVKTQLWTDLETARKHNETTQVALEAAKKDHRSVVAELAAMQKECQTLDSKLASLEAQLTQCPLSGQGNLPGDSATPDTSLPLVILPEAEMVQDPPMLAEEEDVFHSNKPSYIDNANAQSMPRASSQPSVQFEQTKPSRRPSKSRQSEYAQFAAIRSELLSLQAEVRRCMEDSLSDDPMLDDEEDILGAGEGSDSDEMESDDRDQMAIDEDVAP
ncbi:hypothetical protein DXG01_013488, partial [Tephrocybe rancida]